jgi:phosphoglycolate phosphatase
MIAHAVFDLDGTLVDSVPLISEIIGAMLADRRSDLRVTPEAVRPYVTAGGRGMLEALLGDALGDIDSALAEFRARYAALPTPPSSLFPGVREGLEAIAGLGVGLAVWSNKPQPLCDKVIDDLGLRRLFAAVVGTGADVPLKPDPTGIDRALAIAGGRRARSCLVGDSALDHQAAMTAAVPAVMVTYGYGEAGETWPGAIRADAFSQVPAIVARLLLTDADEGVERSLENDSFIRGGRHLHRFAVPLPRCAGEDQASRRLNPPPFTGEGDPEGVEGAREQRTAPPATDALA